MQLRLYPTFIQETITVNRKTIMLDEFWDIAKKTYHFDDHEEDYLLLSNTKQALMLFSGYRSADIFYVTRLVPIADRVRITWAQLKRHLEVKHFEVYVDPESGVEASIARGLGLSHIGKRIEFTPYDVSRFCTRAPMVSSQEACSLEQMTEVCHLVKNTHAGAIKLMSEVAMGLTDVVVRSQHDRVTSVAFITECGDVDNISTFLSLHPPSCRGYSQDFSELFRFMLNRCGERKRKLRLSLAPTAVVPEYDGISHRVISHSYTEV